MLFKDRGGIESFSNCFELLDDRVGRLIESDDVHDKVPGDRSSPLWIPGVCTFRDQGTNDEPQSDTLLTLARGVSIHILRSELFGKE